MFVGILTPSRQDAKPDWIGIVFCALAPWREVLS